MTCAHRLALPPPAPHLTNWCKELAIAVAVSVMTVASDLVSGGVGGRVVIRRRCIPIILSERALWLPSYAESELVTLLHSMAGSAAWSSRWTRIGGPAPCAFEPRETSRVHRKRV